ncbi:hypothetical protein AVMA1855_20070 [Acidovorax sp. SUPP1855]|uniref:hypothetical protein n=1 Tax=Acidovorax sp. SUPP1855 TaxID=431774 RepID=UPI0023DE5A1E|nr:hypothetical protein [Acidovorax sp. SUPP1855]GKS86488.1 hypothetical protein AVMA1855_20070 [Acidovorax sp. SUPP1855]
MGWFGSWIRQGLLGNSISLSDSMPPAEAISAAPGVGSQASRDDHKHPRLTSVAWGVTDASGEVSYSFTRSFANKPGVDFTYEENANNQPIIFKVKSWVTNVNGEYVGATARGYRLQTLPTTLTLITQLIGFSVSINAPAGINVSCIAVQTS